MAEATIRLPGYSTKTSLQTSLSAQGVGTVYLPWWPDEIAESNVANVYETQDRPGRKPLLLRSGGSLPEVRIGCIVSTTGPEVDHNVAEILAALRAMATTRKPVTLKVASRSGRYRVTDLGITELDWDATGEPISAEVSMTMTQASDAAIPVGPIKQKKRGR